LLKHEDLSATSDCAYAEGIMAVKGLKETEKVAVGALRTALQTWLAPQLSDISARLTHVEARLDGIDKRLDLIDKRLDGMDRRFDGIDQRIDLLQQQMAEQFRSMHNEFEARIDAVRIDIKRLDNIAELRERLASVEAKLAQHN
jgi:chromosome segregation ATPase